MCLRITAPFLPSTNALSWLRQARDLVNSISIFSSNWATWWLIYSEPLSAWNPWMRNGNRCRTASSRCCWPILRAQPTTCHCVTVSTALMCYTLFFAIPIALMHRVHAPVTGLPVRLRPAPLGDGYPAGLAPHELPIRTDQTRDLRQAQARHFA